MVDLPSWAGDVLPPLESPFELMMDNIYSSPSPDINPPSSDETANGLYIPEAAYWTDSECNSYILAGANILLDESNKIASGAATFTSAQQNAINTFIVDEADAACIQTMAVHSTAQGYTGSTVCDVYTEEHGYILSNGRVAYPTATRPYWDAFSGTNAGGGTAANIDLDFRGSPLWELPEIAIEEFNIEPVLRAGFLPAIRPADLGGIALHPDRHATIRVMALDGTRIYATTNFMLEAVEKNIEEEFSVQRTFWRNIIETRGERFRLYSLTCRMIDAKNFDWQRSWKEAWDKYLKASVLAANKWRFYVLYGSHIIGGYPLKYVDKANANDEPLTTLGITMFVTDDESLPIMTRYVSKEGLVYFKWQGTQYVSGMNVNEKVVPELDDTPPLKPISPEETEYENPNAGDWTYGGNDGVV